MPSRYSHESFQVLDTNGNPAAGALVTVWNIETGAIAEIFRNDGRQDQLSNPLVADADGRFSFFAGDLKADYAIATLDGTIVPIGAMDTVENHRLTGEHGIATIGAEQLDIDLTDMELNIHAALGTNTHNLPVGGYFVHTKVGSDPTNPTDSPVLGDVTVDSLTLPDGGWLAGMRLAQPNVASIQAVINAASDGETIGIVGTSTGPVNLDGQGTIEVNKILRIVGIGNVRLERSKASVIADGPILKVLTAGGILRSVLIRDIEFGSPAPDGPAGSELVEVKQGAAVIENCTFYNAPGGGLRIADQVIQAGPCTVLNCYFRDCNYPGLIINCTQPVRVIGCRFEFNARSAISTEFEVLVTGTGLGYPAGHEFIGCNFKNNIRGVRINFQDGVRFTHCVFDDNGSGIQASLDIISSSNIAAPTDLNHISGTVNDPGGGIITNPNTWDYISPVIDIDNAVLGHSREFFNAVTLNHQMGTRLFEARILVANSAAFDDQVWHVTPGGEISSNGSLSPRAWAPTLVPTSGNDAVLTWYAGDVSNGASPSLTVTGDYLWHAVKPSAIAAGVQIDDYDFTSAAGYALKRIWVRVFMRALES